MFRAILAVTLLATSSLVFADGPIAWKGTGSGDWNGKRTRADELGLTFGLMEDFTMQQNVKGGISKGGTVASRFVFRANYQFDPTSWLKDSEIQVSAAWNFGSDVNDNVGALLSPTGVYQTASLRLFQLYWGHFFADKQVHFKIGRIQLCNEFAYFEQYLDGGISNGYYCNPGGLYLNQPFYPASVWPIATWGARIKIAPKEQDFEFYLGVYNGSEREKMNLASKHGMNFRLKPSESTFVQASFWYKLNQDPEDNGLPGNYRFTGFYDSGSFARVDDATQTRDGNPGWAVIVDQMVFREKSGSQESRPEGSHLVRRSDQGLTVMANFIRHPRTAYNISPYWFSAGLYYKGAIPNRDADVMSFAFYRANLSPDSGLDNEVQFRLYYSVQITPWFFISPHVHYIKNPGGGQNPNALVIGAYMRMNL